MKTITIVCDDRPGIIAEVSEIVSSTGANIESFEAKTIGNLAIINISTDRDNKALIALTQSLFYGFSEDSILIQIDDQPGALAKISKQLKSADINLRSLRIVRRSKEKAIVSIGADKTDAIIEILKDVLIF